MMERLRFLTNYNIGEIFLERYMEIIKNPRSRLSFILVLVAIHSICVGIGLIVRPAELMQLSHTFQIFSCFFLPFPTVLKK